MTFLAFAGAVSFCVFMAICVNNMLALKMSKYKELLLFAFVVAVGISFRLIPHMNPFIIISIVGVVIVLLSTVIYKSFQKGLVFAVYLTALLFGMEGIRLLLSRLPVYDSPALFIHIYVTTILLVALLAFFLKNLLEKYNAIHLLNNQTMRFLLISAGLVLVFTLKNFAMPYVQLNLGRWVINFGDIAYLLFFISGMVMFAIIIRYISRESAVRAEMMVAKASKKYVSDLEESYKALRTIKHDYVNILTSFKLYIDNDDMPGLKKYYYQELTEMNKDLLGQDRLMGSLHNISISEVKSVLVYKCSLATAQNIELEIEVKEPIQKIGISTAIVCQMLGILLDNAIEAAAEAREKRLNIAIIKNPTSTVFVIRNTWQKQDASINKFYELGYSTKDTGRGMGLHTARKYTERIRKLYLETELSDNHFTQTMTVKD